MVNIDGLNEQHHEMPSLSHDLGSKYNIASNNVTCSSTPVPRVTHHGAVCHGVFPRFASMIQQTRERADEVSSPGLLSHVLHAYTPTDRSIYHNFTQV